MSQVGSSPPRIWKVTTENLRVGLGVHVVPEDVGRWGYEPDQENRALVREIRRRFVGCDVRVRYQVGERQGDEEWVRINRLLIVNME